MADPTGRFLCFAERAEIALLNAAGRGVREIAPRIGRDASTVSRGLRRNAAARADQRGYRAGVAQWKAQRAAKRPKVAKLATNPRLREYVEDKLAGAVTDAQGRPIAGPDVPWQVGVTDVARTGVGAPRGARSRSAAGSESTSPRMSR